MCVPCDIAGLAHKAIPSNISERFIFFSFVMSYFGSFSLPSTMSYHGMTCLYYVGHIEKMIEN